MLQSAILSRKQGGNKTMVLDKATKQVYRETAQALKGSDRRLFMARVVKGLGDGGQRQAERELGWNWRTIRKGLHELVSGYVCVDGYAAPTSGGAFAAFAGRPARLGGWAKSDGCAF